MKRIFEVVRTLDMEPFHAGSGDLFRFRLEVLREVGRNEFVGKVYRLETYRLQPSFPQSEGVPPDLANDALIFVVDDFYNPEALTGQSIQDVVVKFQTLLASMFGDVWANEH